MPPAPKKKSSKKKAAVTGGPVAVVDRLIEQVAKGKSASASRTALGKLSDDDVTPRLVAALKHDDERMRSVAVEMSTATPRRRELTPIRAIIACLGDASARVRMSTLVALNRGWGPTNAAVYVAQASAIKPALAPLLKDADTKVAKQAAIIWSRLGLG